MDSTSVKKPGIGKEKRDLVILIVAALLFATISALLRPVPGWQIAIAAVAGLVVGLLVTGLEFRFEWTRRTSQVVRLTALAASALPIGIRFGFEMALVNINCYWVAFGATQLWLLASDEARVFVRSGCSGRSRCEVLA